MERPFKTPLYPFTPVASIVMSIVLLVSPMILEDVNAVIALISSAGLTALVIVVYYLRMIGLQRLQIAIGGAGLGMGVSLVLVTCLVEAGIMSPVFSSVPGYVMLLIGAISIIAGILNATARS